VQSNKRFATAEDLGDIALSLTSDAAPSITGTAISADGDLTAH
jgi:3-hydroxybutyrate dehydrogenase